VPPYHVRNLQDYWLWLDQLLAGRGGYLEPGPHLVVELLADWSGEPVGLTVPRQRLVFHDDTFLSFELTVSDELEPTDYNFHFQDGDEFVWRKDMHPGHEPEVGTLEHIHDNPRDEDAVSPFKVVELDEALDQVAGYQSGER
jgi:hypothetical protein